MDSAPPSIRSSLDARASSQVKPLAPYRPSSRPRGGRLPLLWWVFLANGAVLVIATILLAVTPFTISAPIAVEQLALLIAGLVVLLALDFVLLKRVLAPLVRLTAVMSSVDPDRPGRRLADVHPLSAEGAALKEAFNAMLDRLETARREAARSALAAQEAERLRIARELHDEIGQTLTAVMLQAELAADSDPAKATRELAQVAEAIHQSLDEVRRISRELRPEALDDLGLVNALIALCSRVATKDGPRVKRELQARFPPLPPDIELVIYRVAQEALTNALRHARATSVTVSLTAGSQAVGLSVDDDGKGMPVQPPGDAAGIVGMRERALLVGGHLSIHSPPGGGTTVALQVPLDGQEE